jgi:hypothetical protein
MQLCHVQCFIGVNIPQSRNEGLVKQQRFQLAAVRMQTLVKYLWCEMILQRLWTKSANYFLRISHQPGTAEFSSIIESQALTTL